jgi:hypothetical protein
LCSKKNLAKRKDLLVRLGAVSQKKFYDVGNLFLATQGQEDTTDSIGELWVDYTVVLSTPQTSLEVPSGWYYDPDGTNCGDTLFAADNGTNQIQGPTPLVTVTSVEDSTDAALKCIISARMLILIFATHMSSQTFSLTSETGFQSPTLLWTLDNGTGSNGLFCIDVRKDDRFSITSGDITNCTSFRMWITLLDQADNSANQNPTLSTAPIPRHILRQLSQVFIKRDGIDEKKEQKEEEVTIIEDSDQCKRLIPSNQVVKYW